MAKTPVKLEVDGYKEREVMMVKYEFDQATDVEGQMSGIPRGGKINIRVKALNDLFVLIIISQHWLLVKNFWIRLKR